MTREISVAPAVAELAKSRATHHTHSTHLANGRSSPVLHVQLDGSGAWAALAPQIRVSRAVLVSPQGRGPRRVMHAASDRTVAVRRVRVHLAPQGSSGAKSSRFCARVARCQRPPDSLAKVRLRLCRSRDEAFIMCGLCSRSICEQPFHDFMRAVPFRYLFEHLGQLSVCRMQRGAGPWRTQRRPVGDVASGALEGSLGVGRPPRSRHFDGVRLRGRFLDERCWGVPLVWRRHALQRYGSGAVGVWVLCHSQ